jgi:hypothetical protein
LNLLKAVFSSMSLAELNRRGFELAPGISAKGGESLVPTNLPPLA